MSLKIYTPIFVVVVSEMKNKDKHKVIPNLRKRIRATRREKILQEGDFLFKFSFWVLRFLNSQNFVEKSRRKKKTTKFCE